MKKLLLLAVLATSAHAQTATVLCANKTSGNLFFRSRCFSSENKISNLNALKGEKGTTGAPGSFSSCYQTTAEIVANYNDIEYNLSCYKDGVAGELVYHSELFPSFVSAGYEFLPNINANGKTIGGGWIVANERLESTGSLPTGLCCPIG
jgi:hypothetical protein